MSEQPNYTSLFDEPPRAIAIVSQPYRFSPVARVSCIICQVICDVPIDAMVRLCQACEARGVMVLQQLLADELIDLDEALNEAITTFDRVLSAASTADQDRYEKVLQLRSKYVGTAEEAIFIQRYNHAVARNDGLSRLLEAEAFKEAQSIHIRDEVERVNLALDELRGVL